MTGRMLAVLVALSAAACGAPPPPTSVAVDLNDQMAAIALEAISAWSDATCWTPAIRPDAEARIHIEACPRKEGLEEDESNPGCEMHSSGEIRIAPVTTRYPFAVQLAVLLHEVGHWGIEGHRHASRLMRAKICMDGAESCPLSVDAVAVKAWTETWGGCH